MLYQSMIYLNQIVEKSALYRPTIVIINNNFFTLDTAVRSRWVIIVLDVLVIN